MALTGTLADVRLDELAALLQQQVRTGLLELELDDGAVRVQFRDGHVCQVDDERRPAALRIGELLVGAGCITRDELAAALEAQLGTGKPLGTVLIGAHALALTDLHRYLQLQFRESLYGLFELSSGRFAFDPQGYQPRTCAPPPLPVDDVVLAAARRIDEWPEVLRWVPSPRVRCHKVAPDRHLVEVLGPTASEDEERVYKAVDGSLTAEELVGRSGLGTFEVMKALGRLYRDGLIEFEGRWSRSGAVVAVVEEAARSRGARRAMLAAVTQALLALAWGLALLSVAVPAYLASAWSPPPPRHRLDEPYSALGALQLEAQLTRLRLATERFGLATGAYPDDLQALVDAGWLDGRDLVAARRHDPFYYRRTTDGFVLLPPQQ